MNFQRAYRLSQANFRDRSAAISQPARAATDATGQRNRHLLALGHEAENLMPSLRRADGAMEFFARRKIKWWKSSRSGDDCSRDTPTRNLASSQIACVNFLLPLATIPRALEGILKVIDAEASSAEALAYDGFNSLVEFEWVGLRGSLEGAAATRGANVTSCDALLAAKTATGRRGYLIEWKCCEEYKSKEPLGEGDSGATRRGRYQHLYDLPNSSFNKRIPMDDLLWEPFYQLMRLFLLGDKMVREGEFGIADFKVVVVCPSENTGYRDLITSPPLKSRLSSAQGVTDAMRTALCVPSKLQIISQRDLLDGLRSSTVAPAVSEWSDYHRDRYGW
ncbi:MAG: hypothetical protein JWN40_1963 [Phycisphaerales bacterium]|nr:hypothetical protein [Phycisphaerales bacterium]